MREKILAELISNQDRYVSGEQLADQLGISRVAVRKHILVLKEMGYQISSVRNRGYRLEESHNLFIINEFKNNLLTEFMGKNLKFYPSLKSTNEQAKLLLKQEILPDGTVIIAGQQCEGKGRRGKYWESPSGGLWFSLINRPELSLQEIVLLSLVYAVAVSSALEEITGIKIELKWPNDIFIRGKKIGGILLELRGELEAAEYLVTGVGVNVNMEQKDFSPEISVKISSLFNETGQQYSLGFVLAKILNSMELYYKRFIQGGIQDILDEFKSRCFHLGQEVQIEVNGKIIKGINIDLDIMGNLLIKTAREVRVISTGDLQVL